MGSIGLRLTYNLTENPYSSGSNTLSVRSKVSTGLSCKFGPTDKYRPFCLEPGSHINEIKMIPGGQFGGKHLSYAKVLDIIDDMAEIATYPQFLTGDFVLGKHFIMKAGKLLYIVLPKHIEGGYDDESKFKMYIDKSFAEDPILKTLYNAVRSRFIDSFEGEVIETNDIPSMLGWKVAIPSFKSIVERQQFFTENLVSCIKNG